MSKEKSPAFQCYAAEYLADVNTQVMTIEEEGCYWRLMLFCWREQSLPNNIELLTSLCKGVTPSNRVVSCFAVRGDVLVHLRLDAERAKQEAWREKSAKGGRRSAHKPKHKKEIISQQGGSTTVPRVVQPNADSSVCSLQSSFADIPPLPPKGEPRSGENTAANAVILIPLNRGEYQVTKAQIDEWTALYPAIDVGQQLRNYRGWALANPKKRKTPRGILKSVNHWLADEQDRARGTPGGNWSHPQQEQLKQIFEDPRWETNHESGKLAAKGGGRGES